MNSVEVRQQFLDFFESKKHQVVQSAPMVLKNDPTLLFTNAGMNQFKDFFLGDKTSEQKRVTDTQKCLRVSGKHNDLEEVGIDTYHHTMFEMLGNWSFGDYFKKEAITWAWELLVDVYKLPKDRLYITYFGGDEKDKLGSDIEAKAIWETVVDAKHVLPFDKNDNFWEMGAQGPCGPCAEIHIDLRDDDQRVKIDGKELVNADHEQVIEIWNLVFIQYNRKADGSLVPLPNKHIDTGMGFERLVRVLQNKKSNYDTDVFQPLIQHMSKQSGKVYGKDEKTDIALRVAADHIRAVTFAIADGQLPANNGAGYVIRRILRRAVRYGYTFLGFNAPFLHELVAILSDQFGAVFPEVAGQKAFITNVVREEELSFLKTLTQGIKRMDQLVQQNGKGKQLDGKTVFELYDTYGFPVDLTALIAKENGLTVDEAGFEKEMAQQKSRSKEDAATEQSDWVTVNQQSEVEFVGYDQVETEAKLIKYRKVIAGKKELVQLVLDNTPFYPEGGGQIGDSGRIVFNNELEIPIITTKKENDLIIHVSPKADFEQLTDLKEARLTAKINEPKRRLTENNHSATHLLQSALKQVLGDHIAQKGSLVTDKVLRFDFAHFSKLTEEEIREVEQLVNQKIRENIVLEEQRSIPIQQALDAGATALFGEKYGDSVRMITFDAEYSMELCGGTHVPSTGVIGLFKITSESSVAAGVRRIEAITSEESFAWVDEQDQLMKELKELLKQPKDLKIAVKTLLEERNRLTKEIEQYSLKELATLKENLLSSVEEQGGVHYIISKISISDTESLKKLAFELKNQLDKLHLVLAADIKGKPMIAVMFAQELVKEKGLHAGNLVKLWAKEIKGGGGGQPFFATAGGKDNSGLDKVIELANANRLVQL
ncbi:MAG: alanine--tRNA ligase [Cyclobacteriaceae bacterium]